METTCSECGTTLPAKVLQSAAGFYIGYFCPKCGPYDRLTDYHTTREQAESTLAMLVNA